MSVLKTAAVALTLVTLGPAIAGEAAKQATLYKTPQCGCCEDYAKYLRENGKNRWAVSQNHQASTPEKRSQPRSTTPAMRPMVARLP